MCSPNYQKIVKLALTRINILFLTVAVSATIAQPSLQLTFDSLGPTVEQLRLDSGRNIYFIDDGNQSGTPVVFTGGFGTPVRVIRFLDFLETMRSDLNLRFITVEIWIWANRV